MQISTPFFLREHGGFGTRVLGNLSSSKVYSRKSSVLRPLKLQRRRAPTARALPPEPAAQRGQNWTPIWGQFWTPIDTLKRQPMPPHSTEPRMDRLVAFSKPSLLYESVIASDRIAAPAQKIGHQVLVFMPNSASSNECSAARKRARKLLRKDWLCGLIGA
jgi:hypothetical protein